MESENVTEDQYNSWVSMYVHQVMKLPIRHHALEECWTAVVEHKDESVDIVPEEAMRNLLVKIAESGFKSRYWFEDIKDQYGHVLGRSILFVFDK